MRPAFTPRITTGDPTCPPPTSRMRATIVRSRAPICERLSQSAIAVTAITATITTSPTAKSSCRFIALPLEWEPHAGSPLRVSRALR